MSTSNEARVRFEILEQAPTAFVAIDREWRYAYVNPEAGRQIGRPIEQLIGRFLLTEFPSIAHSTFYPAFQRAMDGREKVQVVDYIAELDRWFEVVAYPIDLGIAVHFADVTPRKQQELTRVRGERELARAQQIARVGSWAWEIATDIVTWSDETYRLLAFPDDYHPKTARMEEFVHPDDVQRNWSALQETITHDAPYDLVLRMRPRDGTTRICQILGEAERDAEGRAVRLFGTIQDITERIALERAAEQDRRDLHRALRLAKMANWSLDIPTNALVWSPDGYALLGLDPGQFELTPDTVRALWHPDDLPKADAILAATLRDQDGYEMDYRMRHADGSWHHLYTVAEIERDASGNAVRMVGSVRDRTDEVRVEEERLRLERQMQQAQKLESLGVLAGGIAHDFNNLLVGILGNASLAVSDATLPGSARQLLDEIEQAAQRAADLTRQLLAYAGKGRFVVEPVGLSTVVEEMLTLVRSAMSRKAELHLDLARTLPAIAADATQLRQIVMNLLTNASDALEDRPGMIRLRTGVQRVDAAYRGSMLGGEPLHDGEYVFLEVSDSGVGMDAETLSRIFDPFFTTKFTGRGLGLAATRGIVRGHRGAIRVYSEPGKGTTFKLFFPAIPDEAVTRPAVVSTATWRGSGSVLVIDDEPAVRRVTRAVLERLGFDVLEAADGAIAVEIFMREREHIRLALLDLTMPRMDGEETFRRLRQLDPDVRIVLMSGYNSQNVTTQFAGKGLAGFMQKPFRADELAAQVRAVLERRGPEYHTE